jgi:hypothetical protein
VVLLEDDIDFAFEAVSDVNELLQIVDRKLNVHVLCKVVAQVENFLDLV